MKSRFPLYAKILLWFFLNLVLLGVVFYLFFSVQLGLGFESLLARQAGERFEAVSKVILAELNSRPASEWDAVLKRFSGAYRVQFFLFRADGVQLAGEAVVLPPSVQNRVVRPGPGYGRGRRGMGPPWLNPPRPGPAARDLSPESPPPGESAPWFELRGPAPPKLMMRTKDPDRYWMMVPARVENLVEFRPTPATLVALSDSLSAGGLFFEFTPWLVGSGAALLFSVLFWIPLVRGITRSISQMTRATERIAEGQFDVRLSTRRGDELGVLGDAINRMGQRLAGFVQGQKRFLGDIAHELCSPLARLRVALGILEERADEKQRSYVAVASEKAEQIANLVNELLSFSKASFDASKVRLQPVPVREAAEKAVRREAPEDVRVELEMGGDLQVMAEPDLLVRALSNLVRNAVRYAAQAGPIAIGAQRRDHAVEIRVTDSGPGIPDEELPRVFDPFYRLDASRDRATGGIGLGLAIVKTCIESCGGTVICRNRQPAGLEVLIRLPAAGPAL